MRGASASRDDLAWLHVSPSAVVAMDDQGRILSLNATAAQLLTPNDTNAVGRPYTEVFGPSLADRMVPLFLRVARQGRAAVPQVVEATLPSGRRATLRASAGPLLEADGGLAGFLFAAEDRSVEESAAHEARQHAEKERRLKDALKRYLGEEVAKTIDARPSFTELGGKRQVVSLLHADVRGYSTLAEKLEPEDVMRLLLEYHAAAVRALRAEGGLIDRFIGDAILAIWNAPAPQAEHARMAVRGALAMREATAQAGTELRYGIGIHTGPAVVGNLGSEQFMTYTAIGDAVNIAARLQSAAGGGEVVCSATALEAAGPGVQATALGSLALKGRVSAVEAYRIEAIAT